MATHATVWTGIMSSAATSIAVGDAVVMDTDGYFRIATTANRSSYGRSRGIAKTAASGVNAAFEYVVAGPMSSSDVGLGSGTAGDYAIVDANGRLSRTASPGASDDVVARCPHTTGDVHVMPMMGSLGGGAGTVPTGTGLRKVVAGVEDAAASLLVNADVAAAAAIALSKTALSANAQTWLTTPTSANLAALVSDETGTGALYFAGGNFAAATGTSAALSSFWSTGASPATVGAGRMSDGESIYARSGVTNYRLLYFSGGALNIGESGAGVTNLVCYGQNSITLAIGSTTKALIDASGLKLGDGFRILLSVPAIAADRTLSFPLLTGNDTFVTEAHTQTLSNKTFVAPVLGAATATSVVVSSHFAGPGTIAATGNIRGATGFSVFARTSGGADHGLELGDGIILGHAVNTTYVALRAYSGGFFYHQIGGADKFTIGNTLIEVAVPRVGLSTAYASEGRATQAMADANQSLAASIYSRRIIRFTGALTAARTATFPHPASEDSSYEKLIVNDCTGNSVTVSTGTGTTVSVAAAGRAVMAFTPDGVMQIAS